MGENKGRTPKTLSASEIIVMARALSFEVVEAKEIAEIFYKESQNENYRMRYALLNDVDGYIREYEDNWCRFPTWDALVESEEEQNEGLTPEQCRNLLGKAIFRLSTGMYVQSLL